MSKVKLYKYLCLGLLLLNIGLVSFFILTNGGRPAERKIFKNQAAVILNLDEEQQSLFSELAKEHGDKMRSLEREQAEVIKQHFANLINGISNAELPPRALTIEKEKIDITNQHFKDIRSLLGPEQKDKFPDFMKAALKNILSAGDNKREGRPPRRH
jgi:hypothetical protein